MPTVSYDATIIRGDDFRGGYLATQHLLELGCKKIAHISGPLISNLYVDRLAGYKKALVFHDIPVDEHLIFNHKLTHENARSDMELLFQSDSKPDAVFAANDISAIAILEYAREHNISVPKDLKIVGYSNDSRTEIIRPSLTTIEQFPELIGAKVVDELLKKIGEKPNTQQVDVAERIKIIPVQLIRRMST